MKKKHINMEASVKQKLLNIARQNNQDFNLIIRQYFQERFLFRLSQSVYSKKFILKGALLFIAHNISRNRPTKDIDFLGKNLRNETESIKAILNEIIKITVDDGVSFDQNIEVSEIMEENNYKGIRAIILGTLATNKHNLQIDIGFSDSIVNAVEIDFPTLLDNESPKLTAYSLDSAVSEKFEAIVSLNYLSSRMKDFFDLLFFAEKKRFKSSELKESIIRTFKNRDTKLERKNVVFSEKFKKDSGKEKMWNAYINRQKLDNDLNFNEVVNKISGFIKPLFELQEEKTWNPDKWKWE